MPEPVVFKGIPDDISADQLRGDLGELIRNSGGKSFLVSRMGAAMHELYEIPECGVVFVQTDDCMKLSFSAAKQVGDRIVFSDCACGGESADRIDTRTNALVWFLGVREYDPAYLRLHEEISALPQKYR